MAAVKYQELNDDELRGLIGRRTRDLVRGLIDEHPIHAGHLLEHCTLVDQMHEAEQTASERLDAYTIAAVRRHCVEKESIRIKFYHELSFNPAQTVANAMNTADGCRMLIQAWRLITAKLGVPMLFHPDEARLMGLLCGDFLDQPYGSEDLQVLFRLYQICNRRFYEEEYKKLTSDTKEFARSVINHINMLLPQPSHLKLEQWLQMIYDHSRKDLKARSDFDWHDYQTYMASKEKSHVPRKIYHEMRQFIAKKLRHLRQRVKHFEMLEAQAPPPVMLSDEEMKQISFFQKRSDSLARRVKDNSTILRAIGVVEKINRKPGREVAEMSEFSPDDYVRKAPPPTPPKKTQSVDSNQGDSYNPDQPEIVNACNAFSPPAELDKNDDSERFDRLSPDFARDQLQEYFQSGKRSGVKPSYSDKLRMMRHYFGMASRKSARVCRPGFPEINNDLKKSQSWEVPYQQIKATDCGPRAKEMTQQLFHFMDVEKIPFIEEDRRDIQLRRAEYKKQHDDTSDLRYRLNREHQKKKQKKPDSGPNPLK